MYLKGVIRCVFSFFYSDTWKSSFIWLNLSSGLLLPFCMYEFCSILTSLLSRLCEAGVFLPKVVAFTWLLPCNRLLEHMDCCIKLPAWSLYASDRSGLWSLNVIPESYNNCVSLQRFCLQDSFEYWLVNVSRGFLFLISCETGRDASSFLR
jgi:hypothetical protein